jgi:hypothetical protein
MLDNGNPLRSNRGTPEGSPIGALATGLRERDYARLAGEFCELTRELTREYPIDKGVLVLRNDISHQLAAISTYRNGVMCEGLRLNLPTEASLFEKVAEHGEVYNEDFCDSFSGNFFERKLLLDDDSRSFVVHPLKSDGRVMGLLGYSSRQPTAFAMFCEGAIVEQAAALGSMIDGRRGDR